jgi:hypothetical protein
MKYFEEYHLYVTGWRDEIFRKIPSLCDSLAGGNI